MLRWKPILAAASAAFLMLWAPAPTVRAGLASPVTAAPQLPAQGAETQSADVGRAAPPGVWTPVYSFAVAEPAGVTSVSPGLNRGLASPLAAGSASVYVVANGPDGAFAIPAPPYDHAMQWGSFGTHQAWANAFTAAHGRPPGLQDEIDYWASQAYATEAGGAPAGWPSGSTTGWFSAIR